jgi:hypothetical protein
LSRAEFLQLLDVTERLIDCSNRAIRLQSYFGVRPASETPQPPDLPAEPRKRRKA